jgi:hypothetical protein
MPFSLLEGAVQFAQGLRWVRESCVVHVAHLLHLQVYPGSFETGWWGEMVCCFSEGRHFLGLGLVLWGVGRLSMGKGSRTFQSLILTDTLSSVY